MRPMVCPFTRGSSNTEPVLRLNLEADELEGLVADDLWPLPTYQEMLYIL